MNSFDAAIISFLNGFAHRSWTFDTLVSLFGFNVLLKGGVIVALLWWAWFRYGESRAHDRDLLLYGVIASFLAVVLARALSIMVPFRERPLRNPALHFQLPYGMTEKALLGWSSFPSDHAALFFTLAMSLFFVSRRTGILALCYVFFFVSLPRIYLGIHYPTDMLVGALMGIALASSGKISTIRTSMTVHPLRWLQESPGLFYAGFFLGTYQIAVTFHPLLELVKFFIIAAKAVISLLW